MWKILRQLVQTVDNQLRRRHFIGAGGQLHAQAGGRISIKAAEVIILFSTHFDRRHIAQFNF